jgi:replicative DNA helicase
VSESNVMPHNLDAEEAVLAACLMDEVAFSEALTALRPEHFYAERNRALFAAFLEVRSNGEVLDPLTLWAELERQGVGEACGGRAFVGYLMDLVPTAANVTYHAGIVRETFERRALIRAGEELAAEARAGKLRPRELAQHIGGALVEVAAEVGRFGFRHIGEDIYDTLAELEDLGAGRIPPGVPTGYPEIDETLGGFRPGDLAVFAGVPGSGKTAFGLNVLLNAAEAGHEVAMVSAEMGRRPLIKRCIGNLALIDSHPLRTGSLSPEEWARAAQAAHHLKRLPLHITDKPRPSVDAVCAMVRHLKSKHPKLDLVVVDFIQLILAREGGRSRGGDNRALELTDITYDFKGLAKELDLGVVLTCQVDASAVEKQDIKRPQLHHLRWSQGMREGADFVAVCYRPAMYYPGAPDCLEVHFDKARDLPTFQATLRWVGRYMRVETYRRERAA